MVTNPEFRDEFMGFGNELYLDVSRLIFGKTYPILYAQIRSEVDYETNKYLPRLHPCNDSHCLTSDDLQFLMDILPVSFEFFLGRMEFSDKKFAKEPSSTEDNSGYLGVNVGVLLDQQQNPNKIYGITFIYWPYTKAQKYFEEGDVYSIELMRNEIKEIQQTGNKERLSLEHIIKTRKFHRIKKPASSSTAYA